MTFTNCEVAHIGQHAIGIQCGCQNCVVTHCYLHDLGGGGVYIGETIQQSNTNNRTTFNTVDNNIIRAGGRIYASSVGVWIGNSSNNSVTHNEIADLFYTGVSVGWTWGYGMSIANNNHIDENHIHDLGWGVLSDMGAVYTLGISPGTTVNGNYAHNISCYSYGGWGIYNDEGSSGILVVSNLVHDAVSGGYKMNYGETNTVQNNIFAHGLSAQLSGFQSTNHVAFTFENNIVYWPFGQLLTWSSTDNCVMRSNLYWQVSSTNISFDGNTLVQWQALGQDVGSRIADPLFMDGMNRDFRFASTAAASTIGFEPFSFTNAGVYGDPAWRAEAELPSQPDELPLPVSFAPFDFNDNFEADVIRDPPPNATIVTGGASASVIVVSNSPASGRQCLAITDAPGLAKSFYPYFFYSPPNVTGNLTFAFSIRLAADTQMTHEWRNYAVADSGGSYVAGPSIKFVLGQLKVGSAVLANVPSNQWMRVQITCNTSNYVTQGWKLGLTMPGLATQWWTNYPSGTGTNWNQLNWLDWESDATTSTTFYLDDFSATNFVPQYASPQPPAPVITGLTNCTIAEDTSTGPLAFTAVDPVVAASALTLTVSSSNNRLLPENSLVLGSAGTNQTLTVTPVSGQSGIGTVFITADNGTFHNTESFQVIVLAQPPLNILPVGAGFLLTWPPSGGEFSVWQTTNLAPPSNWAPVSGTPILSNGLWQLSVLADSSVYYRLQSVGMPSQ